jgi:hypothetical protein
VREKDRKQRGKVIRTHWQDVGGRSNGKEGEAKREIVAPQYISIYMAGNDTAHH